MCTFLKRLWYLPYLEVVKEFSYFWFESHFEAFFGNVCPDSVESLSPRKDPFGPGESSQVWWPFLAWDFG